MSELARMPDAKDTRGGTATWKRRGSVTYTAVAATAKLCCEGGRASTVLPRRLPPLVSQ